MILASQIATFLRLELVGRDFVVKAPRSLESLMPGAVIFVSTNDDHLLSRINKIQDVLCITTKDIADKLRCAVIIHAHPRLAFYKAMSEFFVPKESVEIHPSATISPSSTIGDNVRIGPGVVIDENVEIGRGSKIGSNVVICSNVKIGEYCIVKPNTTIGSSGFGFVNDDNGLPVHFPHIGSVLIGDHVEIGANCTVVRAALDKTIIGDFVKTDDHVHIAHNCVIGKRSKLAASATLSGSVELGEDVWISPNVTIIDHCTIGDRAFVGIGSVVRKPVASDARVFGVPAREIGSK